MSAKLLVAAGEAAANVKEGKGKVSVWWLDVQRSWHEHLAAIREDFDRKRAEHDAERAEVNAD